MSNAVTKALAGVALIALSIIVPGSGTVLANILFSVGASLTLGALSMALAPGKPKARRNAQELEYVGTVEPRRIIYGTNKVSGMNVIPPWTSGTNNEMLHQLLALAGHEIDSFGSVFFNEDEIHNSDIRGISNTLSSGRVDSGTYKDFAWIRRRRGTTSQAVDYILNKAFPADWDSTHVGYNVPYVAIQYKFDEEVYRTGKPEISLMVSGKKCYDPRRDTGGPGGDPTNNAFAFFTSNPAIILADYLTDTRLGLGEDPARIDWTLVSIAANICDENVLIPPVSPATHQKRYTCNVVLEVALTDEDLRENISLLIASMLGQAVFTNGIWKIYAGAAQTSTFDLDEDDLVGKFTIRSEVPGNEKYNYVRGQFVDSARKYQLSEFEPQGNTAYETEDNGKHLPREVNFPTCTDQFEAQRNAMIILKRSRRRKQLVADYGMPAYKIRVWDVGNITLTEMGWDAELVRCMAWVFSPEGVIQGTFLEEDPTDWDDPAVADYTIPGVTGGGGGGSGGPGTPDYVPPAPLGFTAIPQVDGILFGFQYPAGTLVGTRAYIYMGDVGDTFSDSTVVRVTPNFTGNNYLLPKTDTDVKWYWLTLQNLHAHPPVESQPVGPLETAALELTTLFHAQVSSGTLYTKLELVSSGNSAAVLVTPVNGTGPFTYAWTKISGSTKITANTPSAQSTSFHVSGVNTDQEINVAQFRCRVTDSTTAHTDVFVQVKFYRDDGL